MKTLNLTERRGTRPRTHADIPHRQISDNPPKPLYERMAERFLVAPGTTTGPSLISVPGARALFLDHGRPDNPDVFFRGLEYAHIHPEADGSFHMVLSVVDSEQVVERGWGELHPLAAAGKLGRNVVMVYAPRDEEEIETILAIAEASRAHAVAHGESIPCGCRKGGE